MARKTNHRGGFWHELKRRKVYNVITIYAGTAFIILQVASLVKDPLHLPDWTLGLVIVLLCIGFVLAVFFSWVYDITSKGLVRTKPLMHSRQPEKTKPSTSAGWKIATYISLAVIAVFIFIFAFPGIFKPNKLENLRSADGRISVAVMPFRNMTNDSTRNFWQEMIQDNLITSLSNDPGELVIRQAGTVSALLQNNNLTNYASLTPSVGSVVSKKLDAKVFVLGSINQTRDKIRLNAKLIDSETEDLFKSFQVDGTDTNILLMTDSLSAMIRNYLIISRLEKELTPDFKAWTSTGSPEAYRYFIMATKAAGKFDWEEACEFLHQAVKIDSNYLAATINLSFYYSNQDKYEEGKRYCRKAYEKRDKASFYFKILLDYLHAHLYETPRETIKYLIQLLEVDDQAPLFWSDLGWYYEKLGQYDKAIPAILKSLEIYEKWGSKPFWGFVYTDLGLAYHKTGQFELEKEVYKKAETDFPDDINLARHQAILSYALQDTASANQYLQRYISLQKDNSADEADVFSGLAEICVEAGLLDEADNYYVKALDLEPDNPVILNNFAFFLIDNDRNLPGGMKMIDKALKSDPDNYQYLHTKGWGIYKQEHFREAIKVLQKSWDLRRQLAVYDHKAFLHLEAARKAVADLK